MAISKFKPYHQDLVSDRLSTRKGRMALALDMYPFGLASQWRAFPSQCFHLKSWNWLSLSWSGSVSHPWTIHSLWPVVLRYSNWPGLGHVPIPRTKDRLALWNHEDWVRGLPSQRKSKQEYMLARQSNRCLPLYSNSKSSILWRFVSQVPNLLCEVPWPCRTVKWPC